MQTIPSFSSPFAIKPCVGLVPETFWFQYCITIPSTRKGVAVVFLFSKPEAELGSLELYWHYRSTEPPIGAANFGYLSWFLPVKWKSWLTAASKRCIALYCKLVQAVRVDGNSGTFVRVIILGFLIVVGLLPLLLKFSFSLNVVLR